MADRMWQPAEGGLEQRVVELFGSITFGTTGAVSASSGKGVTSVTRNSAGKYTIQLDDTYNALLAYCDKLIEDAVLDPTSVGVWTKLFSEDVAATGSFVVQFADFTDGSAADPADGSKLIWTAKFRNSSVD